MIIYKITNQITGKRYIGLTSRSLEERWKGHWKHAKYQVRHNIKSKLAPAIVKYGKENFKIEQIDSADSIEELAKKEIFWIKKLNSVENGYNILTGGLCSDSVVSSYYFWENMSLDEKKAYNKKLSVRMQGRIAEPSKKKSSKYLGVVKMNKKFKSRYNCHLRVSGHKRYFFSLDSELEAAQAYDRLVIYFHGNGKLNFPELLSQYQQENLEEFFQNLTKNKYKQSLSYKPRKLYKNKYRNVSYIKSKKRWRSTISQKIGYKHKFICSFLSLTAEEANQRRLNKLKELREKGLENLI